MSRKFKKNLLFATNIIHEIYNYSNECNYDFDELTSQMELVVDELDEIRSVVYEKMVSIKTKNGL